MALKLSDSSTKGESGMNLPDICEHCEQAYARWRVDQRFCNAKCTKEFFAEEAKAARKAWREKNKDEPQARSA